MQKALQKIAASTLILAIFSGTFLLSFAPQQAQAQSGGGFVGTTLGPIAGAALSCGINKLSGLLSKADLTAVSTTNSDITQLANKETCLDVIKKAAARVLIKKITESTVNWINSGFNGEPTFVKDPISFFWSIGEEEVQDFTAGLALVSPFGRDIARNFIISLRDHLAFYAQYSLNKVLSKSQVEGFYTDFGIGGWDGWLAMTQLPGNNIIDANFSAAEALTRRLAGTELNKAQVVANQLTQGNGFLSLDKCVDPANYAPPYKDTSFTLAQATAQSKNDPNDGDTQAAIAWLKIHTCKRWETTTPGGVISNQLDIVLGSPIRQLELGKDLDDAMTAIFDALLNQLFYSTGLAGLADGSSSSSSNSTQFGGYGQNSSYNTIQNGTSGTVSVSWNHSVHEFDITTDLPGIIQDQQDYLDRLGPGGTYSYPDPTSLVKPTPIITKQTKMGALSILIPEIYKDDFCLPGPHPGWENDIQTQLAQFSKDFATSFPDNNVFGAVQRMGAFINTTGIYIQSSTDPQDQFDTGAQLMDNLYRVIFGGNGRTGQNTPQPGYLQIVQNKFNILTLPTVGPEINQFYDKIETYKADIAQTENEIGQMRSNISKLGYLGQNLAAIPAAQQTATNGDFIMIQRTFQNLAPYLVTRNDVLGLEADIASLQIDRQDASDLFYRCRQEVDGIDKSGANVGTTYQGPKDRRAYPPELLDSASLGLPTQAGFFTTDGGYVGGYGTVTGGALNTTYNILVGDFLNIWDTNTIMVLESRLKIY